MPAEPHILHVFSSAGLYGAEHAVLGMIPALEREGISSTLVCIDNPHLDEQLLYQRACTLGLAAVRIPCKGRLDGSTTRGLADLLKGRPGTIMHVHGYKGTFYALRARRARPQIAIVATLHGWVTNTRALRLYRMLEMWMLRRIERICIVAEGMRGPLHDAGVPAAHIRLVKNGVDAMRFRCDGATLTRSEFAIPADAFVFGGMLRLSAEKNPLGLLDAFSDIARTAPNAWLLLAGDGPQRQDLEQRAIRAGVADRVRLLGARSDPERLYPLFDCFVLPSHTEGLPLALLEAMACERPVIATRVGEVASVLDGLPAEIIPPGDTTKLTDAMRRALARRPPIPALRQRVVSRYSTSTMAGEYAAIYRELGEQSVGKAA